ncbi:AMP-dependent synthetase/ligase [Halococcus qingdaonensis]|uniref:AMP-dependent synthetase/ligase n=1 Tax=Halococcus qingdaonensis TaxID=224402 RepID=UPI002115EEA5|nr:long-chain fatty acid--CoA ligase [Halococcus qingdaonensis]
MDWQEAEAEFESEVLGERTLSRMFERSATRHDEHVAQQYKGGVYDRSLAGPIVSQAPDGEFANLSYRQMHRIVKRLAAGFRSLGIEAGDRVGLFANTRMEWAQTDFAVLAAGGIVTTVYTSSSPDQVEYLLDDPGATGVVVENQELLERVLAVEDELDLDFVVSMDSIEGYGDREDVLTLAQVHERGVGSFEQSDYEGWLDARDPDDLASLVYTSGTTGQPKGVRLTHRNFKANVDQVYRRFGPREDKGDLPTIDPDVSTLSFLPLAHVFERLAGHFLMFAAGASVAYAESPDTLQEDFPLVTPSTGTSVPRVYEKLYDSIRDQASESPLRERIFEWAVDIGREYQERKSPGLSLRAKRALADRLVFEQVREGVGGNIEFFISGGGSLSPELGRLFDGMGLPILEGYGLTETAPVVAVNPPEAPEIGTIGPPVVDEEIKVDASVVPDDLDADGEVGELLVRGPNVTDGYWENTEATEDSFDGEWFRTGDVVERRPDGYIAFRERSKQLLVLSTGKNVAPGPIEDAFAQRQLVEQCMVLGDGEKFVSGLVVPNEERVRKWAEEEGIDLPDGSSALCQNEHVQARIGEVVETVNENFESHERIKKFALVPEEFTEDNDLLTPTMKKKRRNIEERYDEAIDALYAD